MAEIRQQKHFRPVVRKGANSVASKRPAHYTAADDVVESVILCAQAQGTLMPVDPTSAAGGPPMKKESEASEVGPGRDFHWFTRH